MFRFIIAGLVAITVLFEANASKEYYVTPTTFSLQADTGDTFGIVHVRGAREGSGKLSSLTVDFMNETIEVPSKVLAKIPKNANGIQLSAERVIRGEPDSFLYIVFSRGSAVRPATCDDRWLVRVSANHGASMADPQFCFLNE